MRQPQTSKGVLLKRHVFMVQRKGEMMMKKLLCMAVSMLLLCSLFAGCQKGPAAGREGRYVINLSEELDNNAGGGNGKIWVIPE